MYSCTSFVSFSRDLSENPNRLLLRNLTLALCPYFKEIFDCLLTAISLLAFEMANFSDRHKSHFLPRTDTGKIWR